MISSVCAWSITHIRLYHIYRNQESGARSKKEREEVVRQNLDRNPQLHLQPPSSSPELAATSHEAQGSLASGRQQPLSDLAADAKSAACHQLAKLDESGNLSS